MNLSDLIALLTSLKEQHGDIPVVDAYDNTPEPQFCDDENDGVIVLCDKA